MQKTGTVSKQKRSKYSVRLGVATNLIAAYVELPEDFREIFERSLALQAYSQDGMHSYLPSSTDSGDSVRPCVTDDRPSFSVYEAWFDWAQEIKGSSLNPFEQRDAVRAMLGALLRRKDRRRLGALELREAAKKTLGWTRWDARQSAALRRCGFSTISELRAWAEKDLADALKGG
jgi:hypothetical protein